MCSFLTLQADATFKAVFHSFSPPAWVVILQMIWTNHAIKLQMRNFKVTLSNTIDLPPFSKLHF